MSIQSINKYYNSLSESIQYGGTTNESSIRRAFTNLLEEYCSTKKHKAIERSQKLLQDYINGKIKRLYTENDIIHQSLSKYELELYCDLFDRLIVLIPD